MTGPQALDTPHGTIRYPAYVPVTTAAGLEASDYALLVMRNEGRPVVLTVDGSAVKSNERMVSDASSFLR